MGNETLVVRAATAKYGKTLMGGFQVAYPCPRCKAELTTVNAAVTAGDNCPICKATFVFDGTIKDAFAALLAEKRAREEQKATSAAEKEKLQQARKEEQVRAAIEAAESNRQAREQQRTLEETYARQSRQWREQVRTQDARTIETAYGLVILILCLAGTATVLVLLASFVLFAQSDYRREYAASGWALVILAVSAAVSLTLVYAFFRMMRAIHSVLVMILDRLESSPDRR